MERFDGGILINKMCIIVAFNPRVGGISRVIVICNYLTTVE